MVAGRSSGEGRFGDLVGKGRGEVEGDFAVLPSTCSRDSKRVGIRPPEESEDGAVSDQDRLNLVMWLEEVSRFQRKIRFDWTANHFHYLARKAYQKLHDEQMIKKWG